MSKRKYTRSAREAETVNSPRLTLPVSSTRDHVSGPGDAPATLVEYGDYQCPYCGEAYSVVKEIQKRYGSKLRFAFRNFPLTEVHPRAEFGAEIAEACGAQGKFWEMHDYLYENQAALRNEEFFLRFAEQKLKLDSRKIKSELDSHAFAPRIREDFMSGVRSGVNGTPTFFVNGKRHDEGYDMESLSGSIDSAIKGRK